LFVNELRDNFVAPRGVKSNYFGEEEWSNWW